MNILKDFNKIVSNAEDGKKVNNIKPSLLEIRELQIIQEELKQYGESTTILKNIYDICVKCGLKTKTEGIGWRVYKKSITI
jgi:hypothetical protein